MSQYFQLFRLPESFDIDEAALDPTYRTLAARFHPDRTAAASAFEQKQAVMMSATLNQAYAVLKNPTDRAAYLLKQQGIDADAPENTRMDTAFLMQQMEWREALAEARATRNEAALQKLQHEIAQAQTELYAALSQAFAQRQPETAADLVRQGRFLNKMRQEVSAAQN